tara:strand:+ start:2019 stop:2570 length:552 start_codon:yes stop_codon:yes gene_type:complete
MKRDKYYESLCSINKKAFLIFERHAENANIFVETGCHEGDTCVKAAYAGYDRVYSCDVNALFVAAAQTKMKNHEVECEIVNTNSIEFLAQVLPTLTERSTFWLDAHDTFNAGIPFPTWEELALINELCVIRDNNIIIDDIQLFFKNDIQKLQSAILEINPAYKFKFETIHETGSDHVMIAYIN